MPPISLKTTWFNMTIDDVPIGQWVNIPAQSATITFTLLMWIYLGVNPSGLPVATVWISLVCLLWVLLLNEKVLYHPGYITRYTQWYLGGIMFTTLCWSIAHLVLTL